MRNQPSTCTKVLPYTQVVEGVAMWIYRKEREKVVGEQSRSIISGQRLY